MLNGLQRRHNTGDRPGDPGWALFGDQAKGSIGDSVRSVQTFLDNTVDGLPLHAATRPDEQDALFGRPPLQLGLA
jgi:hypothetical protein